VLSFCHTPVLLREVLEAMRPMPGGRYIDGTVGGGGHAAAILDASSPTGRLFGCDRDGAAVEAARSRLERFAGRLELKQGNFADLREWVEAASWDGVLLDLGVSSHQLDAAERGFSFQQEGPLDMRMDRRQGTTAADLLNTWPAEELAKIFWELGGERDSRRFARAIVQEREVRAFRTTRQLADLVERVAPRHGKRAHPATKVFQALRMAVNAELSALERGLEAAWACVRPGGRLAVITFHSLEDQMVKKFGRERTRDYTFPGEVDVPELRQPIRPEARWISRKAIKPGPAEIEANVRSRSAQLRVLEKI